MRAFKFVYGEFTLSSRLIRVSEHVWMRLTRIQRRDGHTSLDSVLRYLLMRAGEWD